MCVLENTLVFISSVPRLILCPKRIGPLAIPQLPFYFACLLPFCCLNQKPLNIYLLVFASFPYPKSLVNTFCSSLGSTLLLIKNTTIDPLHLWVIKKRFLAPLPGWLALLVSEASKETFTLCVLFLFCCFYSQSLWT